MAACGHKQTNTASDAQATDSIVTDSLVVEQEITYYSAIDRYLVDEFGKNYTEGEYCIPSYSIVDVDEQNAEDILVWGDFWVFNYNQVGDTLKCVSGGSHPRRPGKSLATGTMASTLSTATGNNVKR